ncbi:MAG: hypothetical protein GY861_18985 [bacterium]|nr:hypothetical protein [bacterium]
MKEKFKKMYPVGKDEVYPDADDPGVIAYTGTAGTLDGDDYENNMVSIKLSSTSALTYAISNPKPGTIYSIEATGTGTNNRVVTFTDCTINTAGNNTATLNAIDESLVLLCISATNYVVISNNGSVALSTV